MQQSHTISNITY